MRMVRQEVALRFRNARRSTVACALILVAITLAVTAVDGQTSEHAATDIANSQVAAEWLRDSGDPLRDVPNGKEREQHDDLTNDIPEGAKPFVIKGAAKIKAADNAGAINDFNMAIQLNSGNAHAFACRGNANFVKLELDDAIRDFDT